MSGGCYSTDLFLCTTSIPAKWKCSIDGGVINNAVTSKRCGHAFGMKCILEALLVKEACPVCGVAMDCTDLQPAENLRTEIEGLTVRCSKEKCQYEGPIASIPTHRRSPNCGPPLIACPFCPAKFPTPTEFEAHKDCCPEALVLCPQCQHDMTRKELQAHVAGCKAPAKKMEEKVEVAAEAPTQPPPTAPQNVNRGVPSTNESVEPIVSLPQGWEACTHFSPLPMTLNSYREEDSKQFGDSSMQSMIHEDLDMEPPLMKRTTKDDDSAPTATPPPTVSCKYSGLGCAGGPGHEASHEGLLLSAVLSLQDQVKMLQRQKERSGGWVEEKVLPQPSTTPVPNSEKRKTKKLSAEGPAVTPVLDSAKRTMKSTLLQSASKSKQKPLKPIPPRRLFADRSNEGGAAAAGEGKIHTRPMTARTTASTVKPL